MVNIGLLLAMIRESLRGTVINWWPRRHVYTVLKAKVLFQLAHVAFNILSTKWAYLSSYSCDEQVVRTMQTAVKSTWISQGFALLFFGQVFSPYKVKKHRLTASHSKRDALVLEQTESVWGAVKKVISQRYRAVIYVFTHSRVHFRVSDILIIFSKDIKPHH